MKPLHFPQGFLGEGRGGIGKFNRSNSPAKGDIGTREASPNANGSRPLDGHVIAALAAFLLEVAHLPDKSGALP